MQMCLKLNISQKQFKHFSFVTIVCYADTNNSSSLQGLKSKTSPCRCLIIRMSVVFVLCHFKDQVKESDGEFSSQNVALCLRKSFEVLDLVQLGEYIVH